MSRGIYGYQNPIEYFEVEMDKNPLAHHVARTVEEVGDRKQSSIVVRVVDSGWNVCVQIQLCFLTV